MLKKEEEFLKQKERLKYVTQGHVSKNVLDPDIMIKQLISDKETFKFILRPQLPYDLPKWLIVQNNLVPAVYEQVWLAVKLGPNSANCDTQLITQFFTSSGLSLEKLGYLWSLTNVYSPGVLTQQELYVMLALIALVQTGYPVKDISIIKIINHPIIPQLDYGFLNITLANPAINKTIINQFESKLLNGFSNNSSSTSIHENLFNHLNNNVSRYPVNDRLKNSNEISDVSLCASMVDDDFLNLSINRLSEIRKSDFDVTFAVPEVKKLDYNVNLFDVNKQTELDVDFSISEIKPPPHTAPIITEFRKYDNSVVNPKVSSLLRKPPFIERRFDLLTTLHFPSNMESKSLYLPMIAECNIEDDDEFTEFQSATIVHSTDEYADFQSASPILKYEFNNFMTEQKIELPVEEDSNFHLKEPIEDTYPMNNVMNDYKTSREADKYDVFRTLVESEEELRSVDKQQENIVEEKEEEKFSDFYATSVDLNSSNKRSKISIREKCLSACLRILREGWNIFSSISNDESLVEVLADERGYRYFNQLKIVYETSQRFQRQFENNGLNDAILSTWAKLTSYIKYLPSEELLDDMYDGKDDVDASSCKLCETKCDMNCVRYAGNYYHVTCMNLFLHFVENSEVSAMLSL